MNRDLDEFEVELGEFRTDHQDGLKNFDLKECSRSEVIFFQVFKNESFPKTYKILFSREDSGNALKEINSKTGTPTPWTSSHEIIFFNNVKKVKSLYSSLKIYSLGNRTYSIPLDKLEKLIKKSCTASDSDDLYGHVRGLNDSLVVISQYDREERDTKIGFVYCFKHVLSPDRCKIGYTNRDPRIRAAENSLDAALPEPYKPIFACLSNDAPALEEKIHKCLGDIHINKEFFKADPKLIARVFLDEYSSGNAIGFFCYEENQKYFSNVSFKTLASEYFSEKYNASKADFYEKKTQEYYRLYINGFKEILFKDLVEIKYKSNLDAINSKIKSFEESKSYISDKTNKYSDSQKSLTKSGGVLTGLALLALDGGASLVPSALTAAGLMINKRKNDARKREIEKLDETLFALYEEREFIYSQINAELIQQSQNLDEFFNCSAHKITSKYESGVVFDAGYAINLEGNGSLYGPKHRFSITALKVVVGPPPSFIAKDKVNLIDLTFSPFGEYKYSPYKDVELQDLEKVSNICALLREYAFRNKYYIAIS